MTRFQQYVQTEWNVDPQTAKSIRQWHRTLHETGTLVLQTGKYLKVVVTDETVDCVHKTFSRSPRTSIKQASNELKIPCSTIHDIIPK